MKKQAFQKFLTMVVILIMSSASMAQDFLPALNDNFMGINQVTLQPAAIADSRFKVDVNLFGSNSDIFNNLVKFNLSDALNDIDGNWWEDESYLTDPDGKDKGAFVNQSVLAPSFLINLGDQGAVGFTMRARSIMNIDDIDEPLARSMVVNFEDADYWNKWYYDDNIRYIMHNFSEYDLSYAREIFDLGANYLKAGVTVKLLQGIGGGDIEAQNFYYYLYNSNSDESADWISWNSDLAFNGVSDNMNWGTDINDNYPDGFSYQFISRPSVGLDLGVVYEFRPKYMNYRYDMDGQTDLKRNDQNKYLLKIGFSVLDIGRLKYEKESFSYDFVASLTPDYLDRYNSGNNAIPGNTHWMQTEASKYGTPPFVNLSDTIDNRVNSGQGISRAANNSENFTIKLPTALSLQVDVNIIKGLYVNLTTFTGLHQGFSENGNSHYISNYSITPRYEHKWFSVMIPVQYNQYQKMNVGLGFRAAFIYAGVNNVFNLLLGNTYAANLYFGVKIPIFQDKPPADRDMDAVSDAKDKCLDTPGIWEFYGCPDRDGDGVQDTEDLCPDVPGPREFKGCPDRDKDGVPDMDDQCPDQPGSKLTQGCPDRDADGVMDIKDECPDVPGPGTLNGCPDMDGDGVPDYKDKCPDVAGPVDQGGCPFLDTDGDGVKDSEDMCPEQPGPPENKGCPYTDTDADGVIDREDRCPLTPGDPANFGCPVIKVEEAAVIKTAFENLEFETGKAVIRSSSFKSLDELSALLVSKPTWKLRIAGHTDNVGNDASNMTLSKNRAEATAKYLKDKGVMSKQLVTEWFGETKPIADNNTPEGRQKNRRVEMEIVFD